MATIPFPYFQAIDGNGVPYPGAKLNFYRTGTSTRQNTYTTSALTTAHANPVVADPNGRFAPIYLGTSFDYKVVLTDASDVVIPTNGTIDPLYAAGASGRTAVNDANYAATISDRTIAYIALSAARIVSLPTALAYPAGQQLLILDESGSASTTATISVVPNGTDTINGLNTTQVLISVAYGSTALESDGTSKWTIVAYAPAALAGVRQTVAAGPVSTAGLPTFLPATNAALAITSQNVTATAALVAAAANGWSGTTGLPVDRVGFSVANLAWTGLTLNRAAATPNYLYVTIAATGVMTTASTIVAPVYQWGGTPGTTSGLITFNIAEMKAYLGNGATAPQTYLVVVGEAATDATTVISTVAYAYNGRFESAFGASALPGAATFTQASHNLGTYPRGRVEFLVQCTTADNGYAVGEQIPGYALGSSNGTYAYTNGIAVTNKTIGVQTGSTSAFTAPARTGGAVFVLDNVSWKFKFIADRGW